MKRIFLAFFYSMNGLKLAFKEEAALRQEIILAVILLPLAYFLTETKLEMALLWLCVLLVIIVELVNSSIEAAIDRFGPEYNLLSKKAKDIGSAAVFIALLNLAVIWLLVLL